MRGKGKFLLCGFKTHLMLPYFRVLLPFVALAFLLPNCSTNDIPPRILVFSKTEGYRHDCIPAANAALRKLCIANGIAVDTTEDAADFTAKNLRRYNAVVFLCTTGDVLTPAQETDFERYIQAGGGYVGIHSATDTEYGWTWYGGLVGAYFSSHPAQQEATLHIDNHDHSATKHLPGKEWKRFDEWYNFKSLNPNVKVLLSLDETSYKGGDMCQPGQTGACHPASWYHNYDGGRSFYTALGHTKESYAEQAFLQHVLGGIHYAIGKKKRLDYTDCRTPELPDPTRFTKTVLASELTEPMELDMFPNGKIIFIERRGNIKLFDPNTGLVNIVAKLPVYSLEEDGLMGLGIDPHYAENHWIYLYYSPEGDEPVNVLSRFVFRGDSLDRGSEKIILKVGVQRQECCHTGGSITFDGEGNLYLSTGDNTNPFASEGFSPSDERPGRSAWDAQKSSANTNDLRGKILRIKVHEDASYTCPAGNLFAPQAVHIVNHEQPAPNNRQRPEIYVMGCRNPFRISYDERRKLLFWGEVGPDAGEPDTIHGPQGHDEVNRARASGFFGWPYFVGDNKPYRDFNFATTKPGAYRDANRPINDSPNNTGVQELPPAQPAFIWYPYGNSTEFPLTGNGGRNAMAGPTYYCDKYKKETRLPDYYDGKLITYDWMRGWMMAVTVDTFGNFSRMEPIAEKLKFSRPMDMIVDKNGTIWLLEYGTQWFATNPDARLSRIDYVRGNRPPIPALELEKNAGAVPFAANFSLSKTLDYDGEKLQYELNFGDGTPVKLIQPKKATALGGLQMESDKDLKKNELDSIQHVYTAPGTYEVTLKVTDNEGAFKTTKLKVFAGNEPPVVYWDIGGKNRSFYQANTSLKYQLMVQDAEDGSLQNGTIQATAVATTIDYLETGFDITSIAQGHQAAMQLTEYSKGKLLLDRSDCKTCHAEDRVINGPAFQAIADRYRRNEFAVRDLSKKIIKGGAGAWGQTVMSAHPQISEEDAGEMVRWILSLGSAPKPKQSLPLAGEYTLAPPPPKDPKAKPKAGTFILKATYRDRGSASQAPLENSETIALRPTFQQAEQADSLSRGVRTYRPFNGDTVVLNDLKNNGFFVFKHTDISSVHTIVIGIGMSDSKYQFAGGRMEIRLDSPKGQLIGKANIPSQSTSQTMEFAEITAPITDPGDHQFHDLYFVLKNENAPSKPVAAIDWVRFDLKD
jgi:cytochrome c